MVGSSNNNNNNTSSSSTIGEDIANEYELYAKMANIKRHMKLDSDAIGPRIYTCRCNSCDDVRMANSPEGAADICSLHNYYYKEHKMSFDIPL